MNKQLNLPKEDWRTFMPKDNITSKELATLLKLMKLKLDFNIINMPKKMQRHFMNMESN